MCHFENYYFIRTNRENGVGISPSNLISNSTLLLYDKNLKLKMHKSRKAALLINHVFFPHAFMKSLCAEIRSLLCMTEYNTLKCLSTIFFQCFVCNTQLY